MIQCNNMCRRLSLVSEIICSAQVRVCVGTPTLTRLTDSWIYELYFTSRDTMHVNYTTRSGMAFYARRQKRLY